MKNLVTALTVVALLVASGFLGAGIQLHYDVPIMEQQRDQLAAAFTKKAPMPVEALAIRIGEGIPFGAILYSDGHLVFANVHTGDTLSGEQFWELVRRVGHEHSTLVNLTSACSFLPGRSNIGT